MSLGDFAELGATFAGACSGNFSNFSTYSAQCHDGLAAEPLDAPWLLVLAGSMPLRILCVVLVLPWTVAFTAAMVVWFTRTIPGVLLGRMPGPKPLASSVWTIHGKRYDMSSWVKNHPGGAWAIDLGRNRDCTGLFESYHIFADREKLEKILRRFEIPEEAPGGAEAAEPGPPGAAEAPGAGEAGRNQTGLVFRDPFHEDVKLMIRSHFQGRSHKMKTKHGVLLILVALMEAVLVWRFWQGSNLALMLLPTVAFWMSLRAHDGSHFAVSRWPWVNKLVSCGGMPFVFPSTSWHIQHVVQHHVYTNEEDDVDLYHFAPVCRTSRLTRWASVHALQWLTIFVLIPTTVGHLTFIVPIDLLSGQLDAITGNKRYSQCQNLEDLIARCKYTIGTEFLLCSAVMGMSLYMLGAMEGFRRLFTVYGIASYWFILATQGAHLQADCMLDGAAGGRSWAKRQAATSVNFRPDSCFWQCVTGGLNMQSLHHVAPGVSHSHFVDLYPKYKRLCDKHGVELKEAKNILEFFQGFLGWIRELAQRDDADQPSPGAAAKATKE
mmetsp:Transcript_89027/g.252320  ORF Transcript_89027/g.252320 Transcript_89027/m.252320 type:complete len:550 (+) Transcript_89027:73-1722(+)